MTSINFKLITPERTVLAQELRSLTCQTTLGEITILPNHIPIVATLVPGELRAKTASDEFFLHVSGGFVQVNKNSEVVILADAAEHFHEISAERAEEAKKRAEEALRQSQASSEEYAKVAASLERSLSRLKVVRKNSHRRNPLPSEGVLKD